MKKSAILALLLAGAMTVGVMATSGCKKDDQTPAEPGTEQGGNTPGGNTPGGNTPGGNTPGGNTPGGNTPGGNTPGGDTPGGNTPGGSEEPDEPVVLNEDTAVCLTVGATKELSAADGAVFTTDDDSVASVSANGLITAKAAGVAKVKATVAGSVITCTVIVQAKVQDSSQTDTHAPFSFNKSVDIGTVATLPDTPVIADPDASEYAVTFSDGAVAQNVAKGGMAVEPHVANDGHYLKGWHVGSSAEYYDFNTPVTAPIKLNAEWGDSQGFDLIQGNYESIALEWAGSASAVEYSVQGANDWKTIDSELVRESSGSVRADIMGLKKGVYDVRANGKTITGIPVKGYDRSGYAHFNYTEGIGAYKDDGTLKDNALVIYVTEENKDTVMEEVCAADSNINMFQIPTYAGTPGKDWGGKNASGIGWWLNNAQYTMNNATSDKNKRPSNTYDPANGGNLGFKSVDRPIVVRFIGTVTAPEGCTAYDSEDQGGSVGDNGNMVRMKNLKDVTIEGVGDDAQIKGWGFHFIAGGDAQNGRGKGFEVRNLTFNEYTEDAVGMEGQQSGTSITAPVERCWIHNNTFLPGRCDNPAESDKAEGDGSCDFKRGMYFTCSYNYFEYCHKTNLIGSSDSSLQYNMTYHHNVWYQCGSRIPLTRQANVHFYNNYVFGDPSEKTTPYSHISKPSLSYVHSLRANCYLFSEANYYEGCKNVTDSKASGKAKAYNNTFYACSDGGTGALNLVNTRDQAVSSSCAYNGTSYENFDTNSELFYYKNGKSDCLLDDSVSARIRCIFYAGALGHSSVTEKLQVMNVNKTPSSSGITTGTKGKGQVYAFRLDADAVVTVDATGLDPQIIRNDGKMIAEAFSGQKTLQLPAGVYIVCAGCKDKEITINSLAITVDTEAAKAARVEAARAAISAIPQTVTLSSANLIKEAESAYSNLITSEGRDELGAELTDRLKKARVAYDSLLVDYAIARIDYIGTVTPSSKAYIDAAGKAYAAVSAESQSKVTNYDKLVAAQKAFAEFADDSLLSHIAILPATADFAKITDSLPATELALELYKNVYNEYKDLDEEIKANVDITSVNAGITTLEAALANLELIKAQNEAYATFKAELDKVTDANALSDEQCKAIVDLYKQMSAEKQGEFTSDAKFSAIKQKFDEFASRAKTIIFSAADDPSIAAAGVTVTGGSFKQAAEYTVDGNTYTQSYCISDGSIKFTLSGNFKMTVYMTSDGKKATDIADGKRIKVNGEYKAAAGSKVVVESITGDVEITKGDSSRILYIVLEPVNA